MTTEHLVGLVELVELAVSTKVTLVKAVLEEKEYTKEEAEKVIQAYLKEERRGN